MQQSVRGAEVQPGSSDALPGSAAWLSSVGVGGRAALQSARLASRSSNPDAREQSHSSYLQSTAGHSVLGLCTAAQLHQLSHRNRRLYHCRVGQAPRASCERCDSAPDVPKNGYVLCRPGGPGPPHCHGPWEAATQWCLYGYSQSQTQPDRCCQLTKSSSGATRLAVRDERHLGKAAEHHHCCSYTFSSAA